MISLLNKNLLKPKGQLLKEAVLRIGELERSIAELNKKNERLADSVAYLLVGIQAFGKKLDYNPDQARKFIDDFIIERELKENEKMKNELKANIASGKMTDFKIVDRREGE